MERKTAKLEIKATQKGTFEGYASVFNVRDDGGDIVVPGAFAQSLADHKSQGTSPALLWQHDDHEPIGVWEEMEEDDSGLRVKGRLLVDDDPVARRAYAHLKAKSVSGLSIGFIVRDREYEEDTRLIKNVDLWETSIVTFPMNRSARVDAVKAGHLLSKRDLESVLRDACGFSRKQAAALLSGGWDAYSQRDAGDEIDCLQDAIGKLRSMTK